MTIPTTREELTELTQSTFGKLQAELDAAGARAGSLLAIAGGQSADDASWSVKDLLAVRVWWTESVIDWIEAGRRGETPETPAAGYRWSETPRLNGAVVKAARRESYRSIRARMRQGFERVMDTIDLLDDRELLDVGVYPWAGKYPLARWISMNTASQYTTARTHVRRALREHSG